MLSPTDGWFEWVIPVEGISRGRVNRIRDRRFGVRVVVVLKGDGL